MPMSPPGTPVVLLFLAVISFSCSLPSSAIAFPLSTVAISHAFNQTIVCALIPSNSRYTLNCTSLPLGLNESYPAGIISYSAIAAGNGFLCALTSPPSSRLATMRWWDLSSEKPGEEPLPKRIYWGEPLAELGAGDSHVCGLLARTREVHCWRWPEFTFPEGENLTGIAVGGNFVCGLSVENHTIRCFGSDGNVVGKQPSGSFRAVAAGSCHACAVSAGGMVACWGLNAPEVKGIPFEFVSLALGDNRTCALRGNGRMECWGDGLSLPDNLRQAQFLSIQAKGSSFCGILVANYSLLCWGNEIFAKKPMVFSRVLPGPCSDPTDCRCGILADSGHMCSGGAGICSAACELESPVPPPPAPSNSTISHHRGDRGDGRRRSVLFIVLGSVGLGLGVAAASGYLFFRFCRGSRCGQVHDSGRLDEEALPSGLPAAYQAREPVDLVPVHQRLSEYLRKGHSSTIEEFPIQVLLDVTDGFSEGHKIGSGSFGVVYRATLDDGREVAIKRAEPCSSSSRYPAAAAGGGCTNKRQEDQEQAFLSELALLSRVNHKNLVRLLGFCTECSERVLVYEYIHNGTLHDHLHKQLPRESPLGAWDGRLRVALDAARGIDYLHRFAVPPIIHRDIKSSNILLDDVWTAKVSDFGLSLMGPEDDASHLSLRAAGTVGYMDPEYYRLQYLTAKSDVYSFGVVLLELLTGFKAIHQQQSSGGGDDDECCGAPRNVVDFAVPRIDADEIHKVLDPKLPPPKPSEIEAVQCLGHLAADCVSPEGRNRPTMSEIVSTLEWAIAAYSAPPPLPRSMTTRSV